MTKSEIQQHHRIISITVSAESAKSTESAELAKLPKSQKLSGEDGEGLDLGHRLDILHRIKAKIQFDSSGFPKLPSCIDKENGSQSLVKSLG